MIYRALYIALFFLGLSQVAAGQNERQPETARFRSHISFEFGYQFPFADLADRFGNNSNLGTQFEVIHMKSLWHGGFKFYYLFGTQVKENVLSNLANSSGYIIGNDRMPATIFLRERGFFVGPYVGKIFRTSSRSPQSGIKASLGAGLLQHKVRIQDETRSVTQLTGDYKKGYDRLTNGAAVYAFLGYQHLDVRKRINFFAGVDLTYGFTKNRRDLNYDEGKKDDTARKDGLFGFRVGWILPITTGEAPGTIFY